MARLRPFELILVLGLTAATLTLNVGCPETPGIESTVTECDDGLDPPASTPALELGQELEGDFTPLSDNAQVLLNFGPQGGQHIYTTVRLHTGGKTSRWRHSFELTTNGYRTGAGEASLDGCADGWTVTSAIVVFVDSSTTTAGVLSLHSTEVGAPASQAIDRSLPITIHR